MSLSSNSTTHSGIVDQNKKYSLEEVQNNLNESVKPVDSCSGPSYFNNLYNIPLPDQPPTNMACSFNNYYNNNCDIEGPESHYYGKCRVAPSQTPPDRNQFFERSSSPYFKNKSEDLKGVDSGQLVDPSDLHFSRIPSNSHYVRLRPFAVSPRMPHFPRFGLSDMMVGRTPSSAHCGPIEQLSSYPMLYRPMTLPSGYELYATPTRPPPKDNYNYMEERSERNVDVKHHMDRLACARDGGELPKDTRHLPHLPSVYPKPGHYASLKGQNVPLNYINAMRLKQRQKEDLTLLDSIYEGSKAEKIQSMSNEFEVENFNSVNNEKLGSYDKPRAPLQRPRVKRPKKVESVFTTPSGMKLNSKEDLYYDALEDFVDLCPDFESDQSLSADSDGGDFDDPNLIIEYPNEKVVRLCDYEQALALLNKEIADVESQLGMSFTKTTLKSPNKRRKRWIIDDVLSDSGSEEETFVPDEKWLQSALRFYWRKKQAQKTYRRQRTFIREKYADYGTLLLSVIKKRGATRLVSGKKKVEYNFPEKNYEVLRLLANQFESIASKQVSWTKSYSSDNEEQTPLRGLRRSSFYSKSEEASEEDGKKSWSFICKREIPRAYRQFFAQRNLKLSNLKRLSAMCQKEARFNAIKRFRTARETAAKNKKIMREMLHYWRKHEKKERENRKRAEKQALEQAKLEDEMREAKRQQRKLNFLITQTELYAHFMVEKSAGQAELPSKEEIIDKLHAKEDSSADHDIDNEEKEFRERAAESIKGALLAARRKTQAFDTEATILKRQTAQKPQKLSQEAFDNMSNFSNPVSSDDLPQPKLFVGTLKSYQLKGMSWLVFLYEQGINGILADEMGLGKTIQTIALMTYLAEVHGVWGPFVVISPLSTVHNWINEFQRFSPHLKVLPYWGTPKQRQVIRKEWTRKQLHNRDASFHVLITSYDMVVADERYFQRFRWQYMVLDEAQAIKSTSSQRWKVLLRINCRNRLLLTGTPIQNSMAELWALLHFIMPTLFDSHDEFTEWFSKDIESHAEKKSGLDENQLKRLHMILKPFMLRRLKRHVQHQLGEKLEIQVDCGLTPHQRRLYEGVKQKINIEDLLSSTTSKSVNDQMSKRLMNLVMQLRKVCNHPSLFERRTTHVPYYFLDKSQPLLNAEELDTFNMRKKLFERDGSFDIVKLTRSPILFRLPAVVYNEFLAAETERKNLYRKYYNIFAAFHVVKNCEGSKCFSFLRPLIDLSFQEFSYMAGADWLLRALALFCLAQREKLKNRKLLYKSVPTGPASLMTPVFSRKLCGDSSFLTTMTAIGTENAVALPVDVCCHSLSFESNRKEQLFSDVLLKGLLFRDTFPVPTASEKLFSVSTWMPMFGDHEYENAYEYYNALPDTFETLKSSFQLGSYHVEKNSGTAFELENKIFVPKETSRFFPRDFRHLDPDWACTLQCSLPPNGILGVIKPFHGWCFARAPARKLLVTDSEKMIVLDKLLKKLKEEDHRVLIYSQMTKMIDLLEEFVQLRKYNYFRFDGSCKVELRRDMVSDFQNREDVFIFLLSTRAGGLGINLTAADTVIFYDSDWNPTVDQQAMDRAHRVGQTRQVTVYRLVAKGTIEEKILQRAQQKSEIQNMVISGGTYKARLEPKTNEVVSLLLGDKDLEEKFKKQKENMKQQELEVRRKERRRKIELLKEELKKKEESEKKKHEVKARLEASKRKLSKDELLENSMKKPKTD
ncbi:chromatin-remodeling ATPase INO80-like isoform X2 [Zophobas morio]|uniref:chromatin-remodeling ATPase INO80-like isoform X2 n=1 Tax=Zophobas morio TaxID=2755281 RepID=UPI003083996A